MGFQLSQDEINSFRREGLLKINFVDVIGAVAFEGLRQGLADAEEKATARGDGSGNAHAPADLFFRMIYPSEHYAEVEAVVHSPRIGELAARLAGVKHVRSWVNETFYKPPHSSPLQWHQDLPHWPMDRSGGLTIWIAIDDVTTEMGPVHYLPRSHRLGLLGRSVNRDTTRPPPEGHVPEIRGLTSPEEYFHEGMADQVGEITPFTLRTGEAVIHDSLTLHGSSANQTGRVRRGFATVYFPSDTQYNGAPRLESDDLGLVPFQPFDHPRFRIVA